MFGERHIRWCLLTALSICPLVGPFNHHLLAGEPITVELQNGNTVQGDPDAQTDETRLWLRRESDGIQLASGFLWSQVRQVKTGDQTFSAREYFAQAGTAKSAGKTYQQL